MWIVVAVLMIIWAVLKFVLHKGGFVHILLLTALSIAVVQLIADRKTRYHVSRSEDVGDD
ncbi:MAG TPA: hypothetical protein VJU86_04470 [Pyrinomonadaceae bacterium]|nr:hypothetical protein [Pyrinomonadaceae bacterium]